MPPTGTSVFDHPVQGGRKLLLAASTGGHLSQLVRLAPGLGANDDSLWVTFRTPQSESMLRGRRVLFVPYVKPRDVGAAAKAYAIIRGALRKERFEGAVSTGAGLAVAALHAARFAGTKTLYIESVSRVLGPSLSGRILAGTRMTEMRTQHPHWSGGRWGVHPSVLETFYTAERPNSLDEKPRLFVTLGTIEGYRFDALVERLLAIGAVDDDTVWQVGSSYVGPELPGTVHRMMPHDSFMTAVHDADAVVTHAGVGTIMGLLEDGIYPVAVVRRSRRREHVDDHQEQIAGLLRRLEIGEGIEVEELDDQVLRRAAGRSIGSAAHPAPTPSSHR
jgi:UDP-N-acetylglucosamine--N-acetylmuramyl-(pentapeptide) pyrophosphoryl-undecaprenol N-acetylglucosamine transferase